MSVIKSTQILLVIILIVLVILLIVVYTNKYRGSAEMKDVPIDGSFELSEDSDVLGEAEAFIAGGGRKPKKRNNGLRAFIVDDGRYDGYGEDDVDVDGYGDDVDGYGGGDDVYGGGDKRGAPRGILVFLVKSLYSELAKSKGTVTLVLPETEFYSKLAENGRVRIYNRDAAVPNNAGDYAKNPIYTGKVTSAVKVVDPSKEASFDKDMFKITDKISEDHVKRGVKVVIQLDKEPLPYKSREAKKEIKSLRSASDRYLQSQKKNYSHRTG